MKTFLILLIGMMLPASVVVAADEARRQPNVLFIAVDDLNDWVGCLGGHPQAKTPNIDRLAARGMLFLNAHCAAPLCNPSRASVMTGMMPATSGVHGNQQDWRESPFLEGKATLPLYFKQHGYWTGGCGKLFHANHGGECGALNGGHGGLRGFNHPAAWTARHPSQDRQLAKPAVMPGQNMNGLDIWHWDWGAIDVPDSATTDGQSSDWAVEQLQKQHDKPFFLAMGIYKPHGPWYAPRQYYEQHPVDSIVLPTLKDDDLDDVPEIAKRYVNNYGSNLHRQVLDHGLYQAAVQAYLANITFADAMIGKVLDTLDAGPYADNTVICLWSDHGWHLGEKQKWHKSTHWEEATRVPLIVVAPGVTTAATKTKRPVSLVDLYPTLIELCGLPVRDDLDGQSLVPLLKDPTAPRERPAVTTRNGNHHSVRSERWRYIRYSDGSEELYDHDADPHEWTNLAGDDRFDSVKQELAEWIPKHVNVVNETGADHSEPGFRPMFNGYDLTSWDGDPKRWSVKDGAIVGRTTAEDPLKQNTFLIWRGGQIGDFEMRLEFRIQSEAGTANSGVQYRSREFKEAGPWVLGGYQADIDESNNYSGILYEERGRGILAQRGEKVVLEAKPANEDGKQPAGQFTRSVVGSVGDAGEIAGHIKPGEWNTYTITARGNQLIQHINGHKTIDVVDNDAAGRATVGLIGLQLHQGPPMTVEFRNLRIRNSSTTKPPTAKPPTAKRSTGRAQATQTQQNSTIATKGDQNEKLAENKIVATWNFDKDTEGWAAQNQCELSVRDGILLIQSTGNDPFLGCQVAGDSGWKELTIRGKFGGRRNGQIFWSTVDEPGTSEARSTRFTLSGSPSRFNEFKVYFKPKAALTGIRLDPHTAVGRLEIDSMALANTAPPVETATDPAGLKLLPGFRAELLYSVPQEEQGSWVSMTIDGKGRLITCDQYGGLYRVTPPRLGSADTDIKIDPIPVKLGGAQGMVWAFDSLYVVVNGANAQGPGLYRVRDTNADDQLDEVQLLQKLPTTRIGVEHGPHGVIVSPNGKSLYVVAGNMTSLPPMLSDLSLHKNWDEDQLLPRGPASNGHATGLLAPGGWVCETTPEGDDWRLVAAGFRNPYDIAFNQDGELFTYDADMEMDVGSPWYRPTRVCHVVNGGEFGWRYGTGKWPAYYPDSLPAVVDIGLGSPTGIAFGYAAKFPQRYRESLFICDWTYGKMFAVHLTPTGASYTGQTEEFISGMPLPLTDIVINPHDGAMYFTIGGRRTQSGLYRVSFSGDETQVESPNQTKASRPEILRKTRRLLEAEGQNDAGAAINAAWPFLDHADRHIRFAARVAIENQPVREWADRALQEDQAGSAIAALLALARNGNESHSPAVLNALLRINWTKLSERQRVDLLRAYALAFIRLGRPDAETSAAIEQQLASHFPASEQAVNHELARVLTYLNAPSVVATSLSLLEAAQTQEDRLFYAMILPHAQRGWTPKLRQTYLEWLNRVESAAAVGDYTGGGHLQTYIRMFRENAQQQLSAAELKTFADVLHAEIASAVPSGSPTPRKFVKNWQLDDLLPIVDEVGQGRSFDQGKAMYTAANCIQCHRFNNVGGILGPDVTGASKRYSRPVMLREILTPSQQISDQFQTHVIVTTQGKIFEGRILKETGQSLTMATDPTKPAYVVEIPLDEIDEKVPSKISMMPKDLLNTLTKEEILDLLAYIESGGNPDYAAFQD